MPSKSFAFGKNWTRFLNSINDQQLEERLKIAKLSLTEFMEIENLKNNSFLDIGCGSGLFSYAAFQLQANKVLSIDVDPFSVQCCRYLHKKAAEPQNWQIHEASILDQSFISKLGTFDIVYSWGVLHHTGDMWQAITNSAKLVNKGGLYYIALYNKVTEKTGSIFWLKIKKIYNQLPSIGKKFLDLIFIICFFAIELFSFKNPFKVIKNYKSCRGMSWTTDIIDWIGGYPYEFATVEEIFQFMKKNFPQFELINLKSTNNLGNNWFLFKFHK